MKLVDMKLPKKTKAELKTECTPIGLDDEDCWPYGLQIRFEKEQIAKMPEVAKLKVGDKVSVSGVGKVTLVRMSERVTGKDDHNVEIRIEKVAVSSRSQKKLGDMGMAEYSQARDEGRGR
jgi:preprotein translocase subunit YajC